MQIATATTTVSRLDNFTNAYVTMGYSQEDAQVLGSDRLTQDDDALLTVDGCTNYSTAKETVWLIEAAAALCSGDFGKGEAIRLLNMALDNLEK